MTEEPAKPKEHLSTSTIQGGVELEMLKILGDGIGTPLTKKKIPYHGAKMEVDGVDVEESVFVEVFAHLGAFKSGQRKKVATDILKFVALQADRPEAKFILAFADEKAKASVVGWVRAVVDHHGIELFVVDMPEDLKVKVAAAQVDQKAGMEANSEPDTHAS